MSRMDEYERGRRDGVRAAIEWLHLRAQTMGDPHARLVLNVAADHLGKDRATDQSGRFQARPARADKPSAS